MSVGFTEIEEREKEIADKVVALLEIKKEISDVISRVANVDQRLVLHYRYVENRSWYKIGIEMNVDESTVRRWHNKALAQIKIPTEK